MREIILSGSSHGATPGETVTVEDDRAAELVAQRLARYADEATKRPKVDEILAEVGEDPSRAQVHLEQERASSSPRSTLVSRLEAIVASG